VTDFLFDTRAGLMLFGVIVLVVLVVVSWYVSLPLDRWWVGRRLAKQTSSAFKAHQVDVPPELTVGHRSFRDVGFEDATTIQDPDGSVHAFLLGDGGRALGEVAMFKRKPPRASTIGLDKSARRAFPIALELTSSLAGRRGLLTTSNLGLGLNLWHAELRQVFPGATVADLVRYHRDALEWLGRQGVAADTMTAGEVVELRADFLKRSHEATARLPSKVLRAESTRAAQGRHAFVGALSDDVDIDARLDRFWTAIGERRANEP
jgi:hypothetical protein